MSGPPTLDVVVPSLANNPAEECLKVRGEDGVEIESCTHQSYARTVEARQPRE